MFHEGRFDAAWRRAVLLLLSVLVGAAWAKPAAALDREEVPAPLVPWVPWVLEQRGDSVCPKLAGQPVCVWPGRLELELDDEGGRFRLSVELDRQASVPLPGGDEQWPQAVSSGGQALVVLEQAGLPAVTLARGRHALEGRFAWRRLPDTLSVPSRIALLSLSVGGQRVEQPKRDGERVWLKREQALAEEPESLSLEVYRKLDDQVPFSVRTQIVLQASGKSRELRLPTALTAGSLPIELESELPARLEPNGELLLQVYPGRHEITITALYAVPPERLSVPRHAPPGPSQEVWVFVPHGEQRQTEVTGGVSIDPQRTNLPEGWQGAAYQLEAGGELSMVTLRRGQPHPPPNDIALRRQFWLDLDGHGYTVRDQLSGTLRRTWRLDLLQGELGRAEVAGAPQLITQHPTSGARGVELRQEAFRLTAESRLAEARGVLPAVAWSENVSSLRADLYLPPGWELLGVSGADSVSESWLSRWDLFAVFFVLVIAVAIAKLDRWAWGALALLALFFSHGEPYAPRFTWALVVLSIALLAGLPAGRFRRLVRAVAVVSGLVLLAATVSFAVVQIRTALYPQVSGSDGIFELSRSQFEYAGVAPKRMAPMVAASEEDGAAGDLLESLAPQAGAARGAAVAKSQAQRALVEQDPNAQIQTGPGVPSWTWRSWSLGWSGPVERTHELELHLLSPRVLAVLAVLRIILLGLFTFWALRQLWVRARRTPPGGVAPTPAAPAASATAAVGVGLAALLGATTARADIPPPELLEQLRERLKPPTCEGVCVQVPALAISVSGGELSISAEVHAAERTAYQLPGPVSRWLPASIELDGRSTSALVLADDGYLHVRLEPGAHRIRARGPILGRQLSLDPGTAPRWVTVDAPGWELSGLSESGQIEGSLGLLRPLSGDERSPEQEVAATLPAWSRLTRTLALGVTWSVSTELRRESPRGSLIIARVPLLPGERVTSAGVAVENGVATLRLAGDGEVASFDSVLEPRPELSLSAAPGSAGYSERWVLRCSPIFSCEARGIAPIAHVNAGGWEPAFAPWPGEQLSVAVVRPAAAAGQTATVDSAELVLRPGVRLLRAELGARVRTSTQARYQLVLPAGSEVEQLRIGDRDEPIRQQGAELELVFAPGQHELFVQWQAPDGLSALFKSPEVRLGSELINARVNVHLPDERWLLAAGGSGWGPAVLFWGHLALILLLAPVLGRLPRSPLKTWQWALLSLGLTQVPLPVAGIVFGWFFVMAFQDYERPERPIWFNVRQFLLLAFTLSFLACLFAAVYDSLLETPNMEVAGSGSSERLLRWYVDRTDGALPRVWVLTVSLWIWRGVMLLWALWLANSLVRWLKWAWVNFSSAGVWKPRRKATAAER